jgi:hypothetical protein
MDADRLLRSCQDLWESKLGLRLTPGSDAVDGPGEELMSSCIGVEGDWQGAIVLQCPKSIARHAAVMMLAADVEELHAAELQEALDELARAVGEKARELLPDSSRLSKPRSCDLSSQGSAARKMTPIGEYDLNCEGRLVRLSLLKT